MSTITFPSIKAEIKIEKNRISVGGKQALLEPALERELTIFLDRTVIEIFLDQGSCLTVVLPEPLVDGKVQILAEEGEVSVEADAYDLECADLFSMKSFC